MTKKSHPVRHPRWHWDKETLRRLYWDEHMTSEQIADLYGTIHQTITDAMTRLGIPRRSMRDMRVKPKKGKYITTQGYVAVSAPDESLSDSRGQILEHRLIASQRLGRPLLPNEVCHHRNGIKTDNRPDNITITTRSDHFKIHTKEIQGARRT